MQTGSFGRRDILAWMAASDTGYTFTQAPLTPRFGFKARIRDRYLFEIAKECLALSYAGLRRRGHVDHIGRDETRHLEPLERIIDAGRTPAEEMLEKFNGPWGRSVEPAYAEYAF